MMNREFCPADGYAEWCRIEDLSGLCGYDPALQFDLLRELPDAYPRMSGLDPDEIAEEHPMQALAILVKRFLAKYPEAAEILTAAAASGTPAEQRPVKAA